MAQTTPQLKFLNESITVVLNRNGEDFSLRSGTRSEGHSTFATMVERGFVLVQLVLRLFAIKTWQFGANIS